MYIKDYDSQKHAAAWLAAWVQGAERFPYIWLGDEHKEHNPTDELVNWTYKNGLAE